MKGCKIEWVAELARIRGMDSKSWNPVIGCSRASEGCRNCYAAATVDRFARKDGTGAYAGLTERDGDGVPRFNGKIDFSEARLMEPLKWRKPAVVFVGDMADLFHPNVTDEMLDRIFAVMALRPDCLFLVLTKRPERMREYLVKQCKAHNIADCAGNISGQRLSFKLDGFPLPNVWFGVTAESQVAADERVPHLLATPAVRRFVSAEPMLGAINITPYIGHNAHHCRCGWHKTELDGSWFAGKFTCHKCGDACSTYDALDWVICGGESGPNARPMHPDWARSLRDQCAAAGAKFFFKPWGEWTPHTPVAGGDLGGDVRAGRVQIVHQTGQSDVEISIATGGRSTIPGSRYMARVGKKAAGRLLDGIEHNEVPT
jgi:protein gp37